MPIQKKRVSPRQKMINLMYVVLMAMLALNVSSDVLNGFSLVSQGLNRSTANASRTNKTILDQFEAQMKANPQKVKVWYDKAHFVQSMSDSIYDLAEDLKIKIVKESDGKDGDVNNIRNREDLEASTQVMLAPGTGKGKELYEAIIHYRERILRMVEDKETSFPVDSTYVDSANHSEIEDWVWCRKESKSTTFAFDSDAEREWADYLEKKIVQREAAEVSQLGDDDEHFLWGKNFPNNSEIKYEYYSGGIRKSYPDFILKDKQGRIHIFLLISLRSVFLFKYFQNIFHFRAIWIYSR